MHSGIFLREFFLRNISGNPARGKEPRLYERNTVGAEDVAVAVAEALIIAHFL